MGLFQQAKYKPLAGSAINLTASVLLVKHFGTEGVVVGTILSSLLTYIWIDPIIIFRYAFQKKATEYYKKNIVYFMLMTASCLISGWLKELLNSRISDTSIFYVVILTAVSTAIPLVLFGICLGSSKEVIYLRKAASSFMFRYFIDRWKKR